VMVEVRKRPDRRPLSLAVYRRLAACLPASDPSLTSVHAQTRHPHLIHQRLPGGRIVQYYDTLDSEALSKPS